MPWLLLSTLTTAARADEPTLASAWADTPPPVTWTFVLETAGGARPLAAASLDAISRFVKELPANDRVEILAVHTRTTPILEPRVLADQTRSALAEEIRTLELPTAKSLDLGAAMASLTEGVAGDGNGRSHYVLWMGTFCHSPPLGSAYADGGYGCRSVIGFDGLDQAMDAEKRLGLTTLLFPVDLPNTPRWDPGMDTVSRLFAPATVERPATSLSAWLDARRGPALLEARAAAAARADAAGLMFTADMGEAPTLDHPYTTLTLHSGLTHLGFQATNVSVTGAVGAANQLTFAPDASLAIEVAVPPAPFSILPRHDTVDLPVRVTLTGQLTPTAALRAAGVEPNREPAIIELVVKADRAYGLSAAQSVAAALSVVVLGAAGTLVARRKTTPPRLGGTFSYRRAGGPRRPLALEARSEVALVVNDAGDLAVGRREDAVLVLRVERLLWADTATVEVREAGVEINARPAAIGRHRVVPGATSFQFQDFRLSWE